MLWKESKASKRYGFQEGSRRLKEDSFSPQSHIRDETAKTQSLSLCC